MRRFISFVLIALTTLTLIAIQEPPVVHAVSEEYNKLITLGDFSVMALSQEGDVYTWGRNNYGQIGDGTYDNVSTPFDLTSVFGLAVDETIVSIDMGASFSALVTSEGRVFTWGSNEDGGELGNDSFTNSPSPIEITSNFTLNPGETVVSVDLGQYFASALSSDSRLFTWGDNSSGQLGNGTYGRIPIPTDITPKFNLAPGELIELVDMGYDHAVATTTDGRVFTWGNNTSGALGNNSTTHSNVPIDITSKFLFSSGEILTSIEAGYRYNGVITSAGRVFTWGENNYGQLGDGYDIDVLEPYDITHRFGFAVDEDPVQINMGSIHIGLISSTGKLYTWGNNSYAQLGNEGMSGSDNSTPFDITTQFSLDAGETLVYFEAGYSFSAAITSRGRVFLWGDNSKGQLGDGSGTMQFTPVLISLILAAPDTTPPTFDGIPPQTIEAGQYTGFDWETLITNGYDESGGTLTPHEVEDNVIYDTPGEYLVIVTLLDEELNSDPYSFYVTVTERTTPLVVERNLTQLDEDGYVFGEEIIFEQAEVARSHTIALSKDGRVYTWGGNDFGQLGDGTFENKNYLIDITDNLNLHTSETVIAVYTGENRSAVRTSENRIITWGQVKNEIFEDSANPIPEDITSTFDLNDNEEIDFINVGRANSAAITSSGRLIIWGFEMNLTETQILELNSMILNSGDKFVDASLTSHGGGVITEKGRVFTWGWNEFGQLGAGITDFWMHEAVEITDHFDLAPYETIIDLEMNDYTSSATTSNNRVFLWGNSYTYQIGLSYSEHAFIPMEITPYLDLATGESVMGVYLGQSSSLVLTSLGNTVEFGRDRFGPLADNGAIDFPIPYKTQNYGSINDVMLYDAEWEHTIALTYSGLLYIWGENQYGQLGNGTNINNSSPSLVLNNIIVIRKVIMDKAIQISNGWEQSVALMEDGRVFLWYMNRSINVSSEMYGLVEIPFDLEQGEEIIKVKAGIVHVFALSSEGRVFVFESYNSGHIINVEDYEILYDPVDITDDFPLHDGEIIIDIDYFESLATMITSEGRGFQSYYGNEFGEDEETTYGPQEGESIIMYSSGANHALILTSNDRVISYLENSYGQLGNGTTIFSDMYEPQDITQYFILGPGETIIYVNAASEYSFAISSENRIFAWGRNDQGQLGDGTNTDRHEPKDITYQFDFEVGEYAVKIEGNYYHSAMITSNGRIFTWGNTDNSKLGFFSEIDFQLDPIDMTQYFELEDGEVPIDISLGMNMTTAITSFGNIYDFVDSTILLTKNVEELSNIEYIEFTNGLTTFVHQVPDYLTVNIYPDYSIAHSIKSVTLNGVEYSDFVVHGGVISIDIENTYSANDVIEITVDSFKFNDDTVVTTTGYTYTLTTLLLDTEEPQISFNTGNLFIEKNLGNDNWLGYTVTDNSGETIEVTMTSSVDWNNEGEYIVNYSAIDTAGNPMNIDRIVTVFDRFNVGSAIVRNIEPEFYTDNFDINQTFIIYDDVYYYNSYGDIYYDKNEYGNHTLLYFFKIDSMNIYMTKQLLVADADVYITLEIGSDEVQWDYFLYYKIIHPTYNIDVDPIVVNVDYYTVGTYEVEMETIAFGDEPITNSIFVTIEDTENPTFTVPSTQVIFVGAEDVDWSTFIYNESDLGNGDLDAYEIYDNVIYSRQGVYSVRVGLVDESGNEETKIISITVRDFDYDYIPGFDTVFVGDVHVDAGISSNLEFDKVVYNTVDPTKAGTYTITYVLTDILGTEKTIIRYVRVLEKDVSVIFFLSDGATTLTLNENYHDATCKVMVELVVHDCLLKSNGVNTSVAGIYEVIYYIEVDGVEYAKTRYVFVTAVGANLILHYRKEEEVYLI